MWHLLFPRRGLLACAGLSLVFSLPLAAMTFDQTLNLAEENAPSLQSWRLNQLAAREQAQAAGQLPDPTLALGLQNIPIEGSQRGRMNADGMSMQMIGLTQQVPNRARRDAEVDLAQAAIERAQGGYAIERLKVRQAVAQGWLRLHGLQQQLNVFEYFYAQNALLETAIEARLASGRGGLSEQPVAAIERAELDQRKDQLQVQRQVVRANLGNWLGAEVPEQTQGSWPTWPEVSPDWRAQLKQQPELALYQPLARESDAAVRMAEADRRSDWNWQVAYQRRELGLGDMVSVQVGIGLPLFSGRRQEPRISARAAERSALESERESIERRLRAELDAGVSEYQRLQRAVQRSQEQFLPLAQRRAELAMADYRSGRGELGALVDARRELLEARLQQVTLETELAVNHTQLYLTFGEH